MNRRCFPVHLFAGFLESGKTTYIQRFLESEDFNRYEMVLLILCEEGEAEYNPHLFRSERVRTVVFKTPDELNRDHLLELAEQLRPNRAVIEYNGMWDLGLLISVLPDCYSVCEVTTILSGESFPLYFTNLRQNFTDKFRYSHRFLVNRAGPGFDRDAFAELLSAAAPRADCFLCDQNGTLSPLRRDATPFRADAEVLRISDDDFPAVYRDMLHHPDRYDGVAVQLNGRFIHDAFGGVMVGRYVMVCCMDDLAFSGLACVVRDEDRALIGSWVSVTGVIHSGYARSYAGRGPVVTLESVLEGQPPDHEIIHLLLP